MSTKLGSSSPGTGTSEWTGSNNDNAIAGALVMPAGGPWVISKLGAYFGGYGVNATAKLVLYNTSGVILGQSSSFSAGNYSFPSSGGSHEAAITGVQVSGGATVLVGFVTDPTQNRLWQDKTSGTQYFATDSGAWPSNVTFSTQTPGPPAVWLYYDAAETAPNTPDTLSPTGGTTTNDYTPNLNFRATDPDAGDHNTEYQIEVSTDSTFASVTHWNHTVTGLNDAYPHSYVVTYAGTALAVNVLYYWRVRTFDGSLWSPWTAAQSFYADRNTAPGVPTSLSPTAGVLVSSLTPTLNFTANDPDSGDKVAEWDIQVSTDSTFASVTHWNAVQSGLSDTAPHAYSPTYAGTALTRGTTYYWRVRTWDNTGFAGAWSSAQSFKVMSLPVGAVTSPVASGVAELYYTAGANTTPKLRIRWSYSDADGHAQSSVLVKIYDSTGVTVLNGSGAGEVYTGAATSFDSAYAVSVDTKYQITVQPTCSSALQGAESAKITARVRWGRGAYYLDVTTAPVGSISAAVDATIGTNQALVVEYATSSGIVSEPTTWYATVAEAGSARYLWHRVTLLSWGASPVTSPKLNSLSWSYLASVLTPDDWTMATVATVDTGTYVYGTQSLKHASAGAAKKTYQQVNVNPNTVYVLSGRIKTLGSPNAQIRVEDAVTGAVLMSATATSNTDWTSYATATLNIGGYTHVNIVLYTDGASGSAWFDALKLEASSVVTPWTPGFVGTAVTIDAGGIMVDATAGGVFRLRDSAGNTLNQEGIVNSARPGFIIMYGAASAPTGWLLCDGSAVSRTTYAALYAIIGTTFGTGDGSTTFNVPDMRQKFPIGKAASGTGSTLGGSGGTIDHVHTGPSHSHSHSHTSAAHTHTSAAHTHAHSATHSHGESHRFNSGTVQNFGATSTDGLTLTGGTTSGSSGGSATNSTTTSDAPGTTDSTTPAATGSTTPAATGTDATAGGTGNTGTANPPFLAVNFIIKT